MIHGYPCAEPHNDPHTSPSCPVLLTLGCQGMNVVIPQPELPELTAKTVLVGGPIPKEVHGAIKSALEDLGGGSQGT